MGDRVKDVRLSHRLTESACCLVADEHGMGVQMEKILKAVHRDMPPAKRILELNPRHPVVAALEKLLAQDAKHAKLDEDAELLYDQALLTAGLPIADPLQFTRRISGLMAAEGQALAGTAETKG